MKNQTRLISISKLPNDAPPELISQKILAADTFFTRLIGLMFRKTLAPFDGLFLTQCSSIHTFFMRFPIDVVCLDRENRLTAVRHEMKPCRFYAPRRGTCAMLELQPGFTEKLDLKPGDIFVIETLPDPAEPESSRLS